VPRRTLARLLAIFLGAAALALPSTASTASASPAPPSDAGTNIVGGSPAAPGQFPWTAALVRRGPAPTAGFTCGASVLSRSWVLTAAHCLLDYQGIYPDATYGNYVAPSHFDVLTGTSNLAGGDGQRLRVAGIHVHPSYDWRTSDYDVALLRLARPTSAPEIAVIGSSVAELALDDPGTMATVAGWGTMSFRGNPTAALRFVEVPITSDAACTSSYPSWFRDEYGNPLVYRASNMVCAGFPAGGKDSCQGDSGGPLAVQAPDASWRLVGVVSFGYECARAGFPGVYHRLTSTSSWIGRTRRFGPFDPSATGYIARQHLDFAGRLPTAVETANWRSRLANAPASDLITTLQSASAWDGNAGMNTRLYRAAFLRNPDTSGLDYWVRKRWEGRGPVSIANHFTASSEFRTKYGALDDDEFVTRIYQNVFSRNPDPGGRSYWNRKLASGVGRGQMLYELSNSNEYRRRNEALVRIITTRFGLLRQVPTAAEITASEAMSQRALVDSLRTSLRYASRFNG
jgi:secreted trypsin-like serine protease